MMNKDHVWKKTRLRSSPGAVEVERAGLGIWGGSNSQKHIPQKEGHRQFVLLHSIFGGKKNEGKL